KYTEEIIDHRGISRKAIAYGAEKVENFPQPGLTGIKFNIFSTGRPLTAEESATIFEEGARGKHTAGIQGTGHGLDFINRVVKQHGGETGCEATDEGNNFYFILPLSSI
ncbi:MAG: HAMP domain-containing histidine kinase, partial [Desulfobulbaceae bacterium]|nr:HAMP domain-containing histidine kinase [Desulfobulbaceae bacterium]